MSIWLCICFLDSCGSFKCQSAGCPHTLWRCIQTAKVAYESAAPTVVTKCQSLLRQRDQLQISLFSTFAISGDALARMVTLRPDEVVGEQSGKLPTDVSLPYNNAITPTHTEGTPKEPSYAPPAYMYAPTTPSPTK